MQDKDLDMGAAPLEDVPGAVALDRSWDAPVRDIPEQGLHRDREASPDERQALAKALDLLSLGHLRVVFKVQPASNGRYILRGRLEATVEQTCVVSLAPLTSQISQEMDTSFWPADEIETPTGGAVDIEDGLDPEPIEDGRLPIGRLVFETLAAAIDPFPRAPDAQLDWQPPTEDTGKVSPFAALAKLKKS